MVTQLELLERDDTQRTWTVSGAEALHDFLCRLHHAAGRMRVLFPDEGAPLLDMGAEVTEFLDAGWMPELELLLRTDLGQESGMLFAGRFGFDLTALHPRSWRKQRRRDATRAEWEDHAQGEVALIRREMMAAQAAVRSALPGAYQDALTSHLLAAGLAEDEVRAFVSDVQVRSMLRPLPAPVRWLIGAGREPGQTVRTAAVHRIALARELAAVLPLLVSLGSEADSGVRPRHVPRLLGMPRPLVEALRGQTALQYLLSHLGRGSSPEPVVAASRRSLAIERMRSLGLDHHRWPVRVDDLDRAAHWWTTGYLMIPLMPDVLQQIATAGGPYKDKEGQDMSGHAEVMAMIHSSDGVQLRDAMRSVMQWVAPPLARLRLGRDGIQNAGDEADSRAADAWARRSLTVAICTGRGHRHVVELLDEIHDRAGDLGAREVETGGAVAHWPGLSPSWTSVDGMFRIEPITNARMLYEEGAKMHHCVGGYVGDCGSLRTFVFSVQRLHGDGWKRAATLEVGASPGRHSMRAWSNAFLRQLQGPANSAVSADIRALCRGFVELIASGGVPTMTRKERADHEKFQQARRDDLEKLKAEAERDVFPIFWNLLPGSRGLTLEGWASSRGLI